MSLKKANILKHATKAFFLTLLDTHLAVLEYIYPGVDQNRPKKLKHYSLVYVTIHKKLEKSR